MSRQVWFTPAVVAGDGVPRMLRMLRVRGRVPHAVAVAARGDVTPIGDATDTIAYGLGGARFGGFVRLGLPATLGPLAAIVTFVPFSWLL